MTKLERIASVMARTTLSRSHLYALMQAGKFPRPKKLGARIVGWRTEEVENWIATQPEGGSWYPSK